MLSTKIRFSTTLFQLPITLFQMPVTLSLLPAPSIPIPSSCVYKGPRATFNRQSSHS